MRISFMVLIVIMIPGFTFSSTIYVPDDYAMIQDAINASINGDIIIVRPGTYFENIDFIGKAITVVSELGQDLTIIDGGKPTNPDRGSVVIFENNEDHNSIMDGFIITNGSGIRINSSFYGGGIYCLSSPTIRNNKIINNSVYSNNYSGVNCFGGGIYSSGSPIIEKNIISNNTAKAIGWFIGHGKGGGICASKYTNIINNIISSNIAYGYQSWPDDSNLDGRSVGGSGGGIYLGSANAIINNTIVNNEADGGGLARGYGAGICCDGHSIMIINNILWDNKYDEIYYKLLNHKPFVLYCNIERGWPGTKNINADPRFIGPQNEDYHLSWHSPCINRGINNNSPSEDIDGDSRPFMGTVDMGADEFKGVHALETTTFTLTEAGGIINFDLHGGISNGGREYILLGSVTGTAPGNLLPGGYVTMPLNWDLFTFMIIDFLNTPTFMNFYGTLSPLGHASATFDTLGPIVGTAGIMPSFAYALNAPWDFVSNPINVEIIP